VYHALLLGCLGLDWTVKWKTSEMEIAKWLLGTVRCDTTTVWRVPPATTRDGCTRKHVHVGTHFASSSSIYRTSFTPLPVGHQKDIAVVLIKECLHACCTYFLRFLTFCSNQWRLKPRQSMLVVLMTFYVV
jgi:hypothetical protein